MEIKLMKIFNEEDKSKLESGKGVEVIERGKMYIHSQTREGFVLIGEKTGKGITYSLKINNQNIAPNRDGRLTLTKPYEVSLTRKNGSPHLYFEQSKLVRSIN